MSNNLKALSANSICNINKLVKASPEARWCVWTRESRDEGKTAKVPHAKINNQFRAIQTNDATQWRDFETAQQWLEKGFGDGVGILIGSKHHVNDVAYESGLVAVDIDGCLSKSGTLIDGLSLDIRQAIQVMQNAGVYMEVSPSGTGLRAFWLGSKPTGIKQKAIVDGHSCEMYDSNTGGRFVTVTGQMFAGQAANVLAQGHDFTKDVAEYLGLLIYEDTKDNAPTRNLPTMTDDEIVSKLKQLKQGEVKKLFNGNMSAYGGDHSSADIALCAYIAKYTDDITQVVSVWGLSELANRDKFKREDYQKRTAQMALESARKSALTSTSIKTRQEAKIKAAIEAGDGDNGLLADAVEAWGGKVPKTLGAAEKIISLDKRLAGALAYDEFGAMVLKLRRLHDCLGDVVPKDKEPQLGQFWSDGDSRSVNIWLEATWGLALTSKLVDEAIESAAQRITINTVVDTLNGLVWDGVKRLDSMLVKYFNADSSQDTPRYLAAIGRAWMIGTVARAYLPGCKHDHILTLVGGQGAGKSKAIRTLASAIAPQAYREGLPPLNLGEEASRALRGVWICELAEMAFMDRVTSEHVKAFTTREEDTFRAPFGRRSITVPRTVSFAATTNQGEFVKDVEARRYWSFNVSKPIDIKALAEVAPQLWAEAVVAYMAGESWWLKDAVVLGDALRSQGERLERSGYDELIIAKVIEPLIAGKLGDVVTYREQAVQIWRNVMGPDKEIEFSKNSKAFVSALTRLGFEHKKSGGKSIWFIGAEFGKRIQQQNS